MSESAASVLQTVKTISEQMTRGLTISLGNNHLHYQLQNMEYWSETDCFNAPTMTIGPGKWGVGAFRSRITCGTKGMLCYELVIDPWKLKNRLFLLIGWHVPLVGDNTYFVHMAHVDSPDFPQTISERKRLCSMLMKSQIYAGNSTSIYISPEVEKYVATDKDVKDGINLPTSLSVCATMATSAIANLKVEINPCSDSVINEIKGPLSITIPKQKFSITKYMEENFQDAEEVVNDVLIKYLGIKDESNLKQQEKKNETL